MSLIYVLISKGDKILVDYTEFIGTFESTAIALIKNVQTNHRATFSYEKR